MSDATETMTKANSEKTTAETDNRGIRTRVSA